MKSNSNPTVRHYCPGGREHGGGIGRMVGYIVDSCAADGIRHEIVDTRGARWTAPVSLLRLALATSRMAIDRWLDPCRIHHIHIAGRGSTLRKLLLTAAARSLGCIHVLHLHDYDYATDFKGRSPWMQRRVKAMFRNADGVVVLGQRDLSLVERLLEVPATKLTVIPNGVPDPGAPRQERIFDSVMILFLGRLSERKGVPELLSALSNPALLRLPWQAVLAGDGPIDEYRQKALQLGLAGRVTMPGWLGERETRELCERAQILVLPSHAEGMAMAVIEGMAHALAVVTTAVGAHDEAIADRRTGRFVPVGDDRILAETLAGLVRDRIERHRLGAKARSHYLNNFSMSSYKNRLDSLYRAITKRTRPIYREKWSQS